MNPFVRNLSCAALATTLMASHSSALTAEQWNNLPTNPSILTLQLDGIAKAAPSTTTTLTAPTLSNLPAGTGVRIRGILTPTATGAYTLAISGNNNTALWLSTSDSRFDKKLIAWHHEPTTAQQWTKFISQQSALVTLTAGASYYIEAQVMSDKAGGHLSLGWKTPGSTTFAAIPSARFSTLPQEPNDLNDNNLPDDWETQNNLPANTSEYADLDLDGIPNFQEYLLGTDPLALEVIPNGLTLDTWQEIQGQSVAHLTNARARFLSHPNATTHIPNIDQNSPNKAEGKNYAARYRGFLTAPTTGTYYLWIAGDDQAELWFSDGTVTDPATNQALTNRFGKQLLAHTRNPGGNYSANHRDFDLLPSQRTRALHLTEGETYYIEVLHKNESIAGNHVSLAWTAPGQSRSIVPATAFHSDSREASDADNDNLPDSWETSVALNPANNGITDAKQGQYGDFDGDGLSNLLEFQLRTNPKLADTDGDGLSDSAEINYYGTNPLVSNTIPTTPHSTINLHQSTATSFPWKNNSDGTLTAYDRNGWIEWPITVAPGQQGIYEIRLITSISPAALTIPISFQLNGQLLQKRSHALKTTPNTTSPIKLLTPFLPAGSHILRIQNHNTRAGYNLRLHSLTTHRLGGNDTDLNGIPDWADLKFTNGNLLTTLPGSSLTSPAYIEGKTAFFSALKLSTAGSAGLQPASIPPQRGCNDIFYAHVPLDPEQPTPFQFSFRNGEQTQTQEITWTPTNILAHNTLTIRAGDSLRLTAHDPSASEATGTFTIGGETLLSLIPTEPQPANQPIPLLFTTPGTYTLTATWTPEEGEAQTNTLTLTVRSADFGAPFILQANNRRTWTPTGNLNGLLIEADSAVFWRETTASATAPRSFLADAYDAGEYRTTARCPDTGRILAVGNISVFSLGRAAATADAQIVETRPDGSRVIRFTITGENLPANLEIRLRLNYQGITFQDGSRTLTLRPGDFNSNGTANILLETSGNPPQLCHTMHAVLID